MTVNEAIFEGRINRREYFARTLFGSVLLAAGLWPVILKVTATEGLMADVPKSTLAFPVMLVLAVVGWGYFLPARIRRLHDFNLSGWWIFWLPAERSDLSETRLRRVQFRDVRQKPDHDGLTRSGLS